MSIDKYLRTMLTSKLTPMPSLAQTFHIYFSVRCLNPIEMLNGHSIRGTKFESVQPNAILS